MFDETAQTTEAYNVGLEEGREEERKKYIEAMRTMSAKITELEEKSEIKGMKEVIEKFIDKVSELSKTVTRLRDYVLMSSPCRDYFEKQIEELEDKHWEECRQIALYDDEVKQLKKEIAEKYVKREEGRGK